MLRRVNVGRVACGLRVFGSSQPFLSSNNWKSALNALSSNAGFLCTATLWESGFGRTSAQGLVRQTLHIPTLVVQNRWYSFSHRPSSSPRPGGARKEEKHQSMDDDESESTGLYSEGEEERSRTENGNGTSGETRISKQDQRDSVDPFRNVRNHSFLRELVQRIQKEMPPTRSAYETYSKDVVNLYIRPLLQLVDKAFTVDQLHQLAEKINPSVLRDTLRSETAQRAYHVFFSAKLGTILDWSVEDFLRRRYESIHLSWEPMEVVAKRFNWSAETMTNSDILVYLSKFDHLIELARTEMINGKPKALPIRNPLELARRGGISPSVLLIRRKPGEYTEPSLTESIRLMGSSSLTSPSSKSTRSRRMISKDSVPGVFRAVEESVGVDDVLFASSGKVRRAIDTVSPTRQAHHPAGRMIKEFSLGRRDIATPSSNSISPLSSSFSSKTSDVGSYSNYPRNSAEKKGPQEREENDDEEKGTPNTSFNQYEFDNLCGVYHRRKVEISLLRRRLSNITSSDQAAMLQERLTIAKKELNTVGEQLKVLRALKDELKSPRGGALKSGTATVTASTTTTSTTSFRNTETKGQGMERMTPATGSSYLPEDPVERTPTPSSSKNDNAAADQEEEEVEAVEEEDEGEVEDMTAQEAESEEEEGMISSISLEDELSDVPPSGVFSNASPDDEEEMMECEGFTSEKESAAAELAANAAKEFEDDEIEQRVREEDPLLDDHEEYASRVTRRAAASRSVRVLEEETEDYDTMQELERAEEELEMEGSTPSVDATVEGTEEELQEQTDAAPLESCEDEVGEKSVGYASFEQDGAHPGAEEVDVEEDCHAVQELVCEEDQLRQKMEATQRVLEQTTREWLALEKRMKEALDLHSTRLLQFEKELESVREREERVRSVEERLTREEVEYSALRDAEERARAAEEKLEAEREATRKAQEAARLAHERQLQAEQAVLEYEKVRMEGEESRSSLSASSPVVHDTTSFTTLNTCTEDTENLYENSSSSEATATTTSSSSSGLLKDGSETAPTEKESAEIGPSASDVPLMTKRADSSYSVSDFMCTPEQYDGLHFAAKRLRREIAALEQEMEDGDAEDDETLMSVLAASRADLEELEECITSVQHNADWAAASDVARERSESENLFSISPAARALQEAIDTHNFNLTLLEKRLHVATQRGVISKLEQGIVHARRELSRLRREQERLRRLGDTDVFVAPSDREQITSKGKGAASCTAAAHLAEKAEEEVDQREVEDEEGVEASSRTDAYDFTEEVLEEEVEVEEEDLAASEEKAAEEYTANDEETVEEIEEETTMSTTPLSSLTASQEVSQKDSEMELKSLNCFNELKEMTRDLFEDFETHTDEDLRSTAEEEEEEEEMKYEEAVTLKRHLDTMVSDIQNLQRTIRMQGGDGSDEESATVMTDLKEKERQLLQIREDVVRRLQEGKNDSVDEAEAVEEAPIPSTVVAPRTPHVDGSTMLSSSAMTMEGSPKPIPSRRMGMITKKRVYAR